MKRSPSIAYLPWQNSCCAFRRSPYLAQKFGFQIYDSSQKYDLIIVNESCDLKTWSLFPQTDTKILFDVANTFFSQKPMVRGFSRLLQAGRYVERNHYQYFCDMLNRADAVVCNTPEQADDFRKYNPVVFDILDFNASRAEEVKTDYSRKLTEPVHIVWEGGGNNIRSFRDIAPILQKVHWKSPIALHLLTDLECASHRVPQLRWSVKKALQHMLGDVPFYLYEWNQTMLSRITTRCDFAILPIQSGLPSAWTRPENRLMIFWHMALPVIATATPAYGRAMQAAHCQALACSDPGEWEERLSLLIENQSQRYRYAQLGHEYAQTEASDQVLTARWVKVIESVLCADLLAS